MLEIENIQGQLGLWERNKGCKMKKENKEEN